MTTPPFRSRATRPWPTRSPALTPAHRSATSTAGRRPAPRHSRATCTHRASQSTRDRVAPDPESRMTLFDLDPEIRPDRASLHLGSFNFPKVVSVNEPGMTERLLERMNESEVKPELEVFELGMINTAHVLMERGLIG